MQHFNVKFANDSPEALSALSLVAANFHEVLAFIADHTSRKPVELWREGRLLGQLEHLAGKQGSFWRLT